MVPSRTKAGSTRARIIVASALLCSLSIGSFIAEGRLPESEVWWSSIEPIADTRWKAAPGAALEGDAAELIERLRIDHCVSIDRALSGLNARFNGWRDRSGVFTQDLMRWSTRGSLAWRSVRDFFGSGEALRRELVRERFEAMIVDRSAARDALAESFDRLALELRADRARTLARVRTRIEHVDARGDSWTQSEQEQMLDSIQARLDHELIQQADRSLVMAVTGLVSATIVTEAVAASIGAAAASAAIGAGSGSVVPGVGTAVGLTAGLAAGIAIDWWMSERLRSELADRCAHAIDRWRDQVIDGDAERGRRGVRQLFEEAAEREAIELGAMLAPLLGEER